MHPIAKYKTSRDYSLLWDLAQDQSIVCVVDYRFGPADEGPACRDVCHTLKPGYFLEVSARGIGYVTAANISEFTQQCESLNLEWFPPAEVAPLPGQEPVPDGECMCNVNTQGSGDGTCPAHEKPDGLDALIQVESKRHFGHMVLSDYMHDAEGITAPLAEYVDALEIAETCLQRYVRRALTTKPGAEWREKVIVLGECKVILASLDPETHGYGDEIVILKPDGRNLCLGQPVEDMAGNYKTSDPRVLVRIVVAHPDGADLLIERLKKAGDEAERRINDAVKAPPKDTDDGR